MSFTTTQYNDLDNCMKENYSRIVNLEQALHQQKNTNHELQQKIEKIEDIATKLSQELNALKVLSNTVVSPADHTHDDKSDSETVAKTNSVPADDAEETKHSTGGNINADVINGNVGAGEIQSETPFALRDDDTDKTDYLL